MAYCDEFDRGGPGPTPRRPAPAEPVHRAEALLGREGTAHILLGDRTYVLRLTRAGKLILTK